MQPRTNSLYNQLDTEIRANSTVFQYSTPQPDFHLHKLQNNFLLVLAGNGSPLGHYALT